MASNSSVTDKEMRLVLIGNTGSGKSSSANTILGEKRFLSEASSKSITTTCKVEHKTRFGRDIVIIDTPGAFDTEGKQEENTNEIVKCITMCAPGPHAFIMVVQAKRFTPEEQKTIKYFQRVFGKALFDYLFLLFTHVESLEQEGKSLEDFLVDASEHLKTLITECGQRYVGFNNLEIDENKKEIMVLQLIEMINENVEKKNGEFYKSEFFETAEQEVQEIEQKILKEIEEKLQNELQILLNEFEENKMRKRKAILEEKEEKIRKLEQEILNDKQGKDENQEMKSRRAEIEEEFSKKMKAMKDELKSELKKQVQMVKEIFRRHARNKARNIASTSSTVLRYVGGFVLTVLGFVLVASFFPH